MIFNKSMGLKNLFQSKIERFLAKRVLVLFLIIAAADILFLPEKWKVLAGLTIGGIYGLLRLNSHVVTFSRVISQNKDSITKSQSNVKYILNQIIIFSLLAASLKINQWLFAGVVAGMLLVMMVIMINGITESLGITHNNFE